MQCFSGFLVYGGLWTGNKCIGNVTRKVKRKPYTNNKINHAMQSRLTFQKSIKPMTPTITEAIAKVMHKEHRRWGINNKETMNIAVDATVTFSTVFSNIAEYWLKYVNAWLYTIREASHFSVMSGTGVTWASYWLKKKYRWFEWRPGSKWFPVMM